MVICSCTAKHAGASSTKPWRWSKQAHPCSANDEKAYWDLQGPQACLGCLATKPAQPSPRLRGTQGCTNTRKANNDASHCGWTLTSPPPTALWRTPLRYGKSQPCCAPQPHAPAPHLCLHPARRGSADARRGRTRHVAVVPASPPAAAGAGSGCSGNQLALMPPRSTDQTRASARTHRDSRPAPTRSLKRRGATDSAAPAQGRPRLSAQAPLAGGGIRACALAGRSGWDRPGPGCWRVGWVVCVSGIPVALLQSR